MIKHKILIVLCILGLLLNYGCAPTMLEFKQLKTIESTSKSAFNKVEPKLKELKTRENIHSKLEWHNLTFPDIKVENGFSLRDILKSHMTPDQFHEAEKKLREMEKGTDVWDVVKKLNGNYFTPNSGIGYALLMDGYLNYKGGSWHKMTSNGLFLVWPFGYLDGETEVPKLSLIFKNGKLYKLVEYAAKAEIERVFAD